MPLIKSAAPQAISANIREMSKNHPHDQAVAAALDTARRAKRKRKRGGKIHVGPIIGNTGGRADERPIDVPDKCYVIPADIVSGLGQGNTLHGHAILAKMFPHPRASGGKVSVPIAAADGEEVVSPEQLEAKFGGDIDYAHKAMDAWVKHERKNIIHTMSRLPGPAQD
jgi:hypothetical protein